MSDGREDTPNSLWIERFLLRCLRDRESVAVVPKHFQEGEQRDLSSLKDAVFPDRSSLLWTGWAGPAESVAKVLRRGVQNVHVAAAP